MKAKRYNEALESIVKSILDERGHMQRTTSILDAIQREDVTRNEIAQLYRLALMDGPTGADWRLVNEAIMDRWSVAGLSYIKTLAWSRKDIPGRAVGTRG